jgi:hypothetical protein
MRDPRLNRFLPVMAFAMFASFAPATTIFQNLGGPDVGAAVFSGQSFTTPSGGPWDDISFNLYSNVPATTPTAGGTAFLLTEEYLGTPAGLSGSTPGFLAQSTGISGGVWDFAAGVVLNPSTQYWIYENASLVASGNNDISGGQQYFTYSSSTDFAAEGISANFTLSGSAVPEPSTAGLTGLALAALVIAARRFRKLIVINWSHTRRL